MADRAEVVSLVHVVPHFIHRIEPQVTEFTVLVSRVVVGCQLLRREGLKLKREPVTS